MAIGGSVFASVTYGIRSFASDGPSMNTTLGFRARSADWRWRATVGEWWRTGNQYSGSASTASTRRPMSAGSRPASVGALRTACIAGSGEFTAEGAVVSDAGLLHSKPVFWDRVRPDNGQGGW